MTANTRKNARPAETAAATAGNSRVVRYVVLAAGAGLLLFLVLMWVALAPRGSAARGEAELAALQRPHAATVGNPAAKVTIVEFMDPACETCREFYPLVKGLMDDHRGRVRLSIRLVAFHPGSDVAVRALEASKRQDKFWPVLEGLLASQPRWVVNHRVDPDALRAQIKTLDLDFARLESDMNSPEVARNVALDAQDSKTLKVVATPEYFVNGRGLPEFGYEPLQRLIRDEVANAYR